MSIDPRTPCLVGGAQRTWHLRGDEQSPEPLEMQAEVVSAALVDAGAATDLHDRVDSLGLVYCMSWDYDDPVGRLAERLGIDPGHRATSGMSGTSHQTLQLAAARGIAAGDIEVAVVVGAEALDTKRRLRFAGLEPAWSSPAPEPRPMPFDWPFHPSEMAHQMFMAYTTFALRGVARRAHLAMDVDGHRHVVGNLLAPMTEVAAANPYAWFPRVHSADFLATASPDNRMVAYPYTKYTVAIMDVDMAAATVLMSHAAAERYGVPKERRVYLRGAAEALDARYVAEHPELWRSPAMEWCAGRVLDLAGIGVDEIGPMDLYSCFASSIKFALDALDIPLDEVGDRSVTVTGGLPFCGGPAANYVGHSSASMIESLRERPGEVGLVTGVGMHMTKHSWAAWSTEPSPRRPGELLASTVPGSAPSAEVLPIVDDWSGPATLAAYSVLHDRDGAAEFGVGVADVDGGRAYVRIEDPDDLVELEALECVGRPLTVRSREGINVAGINVAGINSIT